MKSEETSIRIVLCRHGETNWNVEGRIKGQKEDLFTYFTETGTYQILRVSEWLKAKGVNSIFTSDLYRAVETSKTISTMLNVPVYIYKKFRGLNMGNCQGMLMDDFLKTQEAQKAFSDYDYQFAGGESINQLIKRFVEGLNTIYCNYPYDVVAVVSHGAAISNIKASISGDKYADIDYCIIEICGEDWSVIEAGTYDVLLDLQ